MKPTTLKERLNDLDEEAIFEEATESGMSDEDLKIEALKIATNIGKLMSDVTTEDIVSIAETVAKFIKGGDDAELETTTSNDTEDETENTETENAEDTEETPEEFETNDEGSDETENAEETTDESENESADEAEDFEV